MSWYVFVPLVVVLTIGAALVVAIWLDRKG
jgi:hypothetical protein